MNNVIFQDDFPKATYLNLYSIVFSVVRNSSHFDIFFEPIVKLLFKLKTTFQIMTSFRTLTRFSFLNEKLSAILGLPFYNCKNVKLTDAEYFKNNPKAELHN